MAKLISFDIDGTLEFGDPPGILTVEMVRTAQEIGYIVGSCSDRTVANQKRLWAEHSITVAFTVLKHQLAEVKSRFSAEAYYHIGDSDMDEYYSGKAGFLFLPADASAPLVLGLSTAT